ncbi:MAG: type I DNA topoisomerase [Phycisphaeraceae bacterium]|nr:type I DNA topoisomerase [Phycisphaeraceae bacterium]
MTPMAAKKSAKRSKSRRSTGQTSARSQSAPNAAGKHLVIVESPTKAKTINQYLGQDYVVMASVGHVRDLPPRNPKGVSNPVPGVDLKHDFEPTYEVMKESEKTVAQLRRAARQADDVWFATDLDREGEAIAWHLAHALDYPLAQAKRVVFNAITKDQIAHAFQNPHAIDVNKVDAQQARRILDRIVGYQVSPLLWKKVAGGLSAGRVQSVAVRLTVERERQIEGFVPDEHWKISGIFAADPGKAGELAKAWRQWLSEHQEDGNGATVKDKLAWLSKQCCIQAELVEFDGRKFDPLIEVDPIIGPLDDLSPDAIRDRLQRAADAFADQKKHDLTPQVADVAEACGLSNVKRSAKEDPDSRGPAHWQRSIEGTPDKARGDYRIKSVETKRTKSNPVPPFITSTLQQAASTRLGFPLQRTMRIAQQLYEGINIHGKEGLTGLITYMRTDSTHLSGQALDMARHYIGTEWGDQYLPDKPRFYASSNKSAQEAHEAIRPTDVQITPKRVRPHLTDEQFRLYQLIWERFLGCQMTPAEWDATTVLLNPADDSVHAVFKATGRQLVFDGFYRATGVPQSGELILPELKQDQKLSLLDMTVAQNFTSPPPRYTEASLQKKLEEEGIGRPSTYASIIATIQDRKYAQQISRKDRRLFATDLGKVVTDMLIEAFPKIMDVGYTRDMEAELDKIESDRHDWRQMLHQFYGPFKDSLEHAHENMQHAKAATEPAPFKCAECGAPTVYRFGRNGRFLSCSRYPDCKFAAPIDRHGKPQQPQQTDVLCPECGGVMTKRTGRFGPFLGCVNYPECKGIVKLDPKKGHVVLPKAPPMTSDVPCPKCESPLYVRDSKRGLWLSCSTFPKCRGRVAFNSLEEKKQKELEKVWAEHLKQNPVPQVRLENGRVLQEGEEYHPQVNEDENSLATTSGGGGRFG